LIKTRQIISETKNKRLFQYISATVLLQR